MASFINKFIEIGERTPEVEWIERLEKIISEQEAELNRRVRIRDLEKLSDPTFYINKVEVYNQFRGEYQALRDRPDIKEAMDFRDRSGIGRAVSLYATAGSLFYLGKSGIRAYQALRRRRKEEGEEAV